MFFGNSRISIKDRIADLCGQFQTSNYIITFIDESCGTYTNFSGDQVLSEWTTDKNKWNEEMTEFESCGYLVFDITMDPTFEQCNDYIWPENALPSNLPPIPQENIIKIFRPDSSSQLDFYNRVLSGIESRWGSGIWGEMAAQGKNLILYVDNSGSMETPLIQDALNLLRDYAIERGVSVTIQENCENERWILWGMGGYHDGISADCDGPCFNGKKCVCGCSDPCTRTSIICVGPNEECPECNPDDIICDEGNNPPSSILRCTQAAIISPGGSEECDLGKCDRCEDPPYTGEIYKCVECYYLEKETETPTLTGNPICVTASHSITSGTTFGHPTRDPPEGDFFVWNFDPASGTGSYPISGVSPCPAYHPDIGEDSSTFWYGVYCGCTSCGPGDICNSPNC